MTLVEEAASGGVLLGADEYEGLLETLDILSAPGEREEIEAGRAELDADRSSRPTVLARYLRHNG